MKIYLKQLDDNILKCSHILDYPTIQELYEINHMSEDKCPNSEIYMCRNYISKC